LECKQALLEQIVVSAAHYAIGNESASYTTVKGYLSDGDTAVNDYLKSVISLHFPDDLILSEEDDSSYVGSLSSGKYLWILDPICGTTNYTRGIPFYVHSLSILDADGVLYAGVYDSSRDELFLADRKQTTLNGKVVYVSNTKNIREAIIALNCNQSTDSVCIADLVRNFAPPITRRVKIFESANLELAYVACGRLDGYVNPDDKVWDAVAGSLMIGSASGKIKILSGSLSPFDRNLRGIIASNQYLMEPLLDCLGEK